MEKIGIKIAVIGHLDSGKSTTFGHLLYMLGKITEYEMGRLAKVALEKDARTHRYAMVLDRLFLERRLGTSIENSLANFETPKFVCTLIDTPGHHDYIKNMITDTFEADCAVLMVNAAEPRMGQTQEHALLAFTLGVNQIIICCNQEKIEMEKIGIKIAVIGHLDSRKSTTFGHLLYMLGKITEYEMGRLAKVALEKDARTHRYAMVLDRLFLDRRLGTSIENSLANFETPKFVCTLIDTPGHHDYIKNMITGTFEADCAVLMVNAAEPRMGQTQEHALLAFTLGVNQIIICCNQMDLTEPRYSKRKYEEIVEQFSPYLQMVGYALDKILFVPISGFVGDNLTERTINLGWFKGPTLLKAIDKVSEPKGPLYELFSCLPTKSFTADIIVFKDGHITEGYKAVLEFHTSTFTTKNYSPWFKCHTSSHAVAFSQILTKNDKVSGVELEKDPMSLSEGEAGTVRVTLAEYPPLGWFTVRDLQKTVALGLIKSFNKKV